MAALSTILDVTGRSRVRVIYPCDIYGSSSSTHQKKNADDEKDEHGLSKTDNLNIT
jgi:hypothetical protein